PVPAADRAAAVRRGLAAGRLSFLLQGEKLRGGWSLVRLRRGEGKDWLLIKRDDEAAARGRDVLADGRSGPSGRMIEARPGGRGGCRHCPLRVAAPSTACLAHGAPTPPRRPRPPPALRHVPGRGDATLRGHGVRAGAGRRRGSPGRRATGRGAGT